MRIAIYGATGMVGSQITAEAMRRGHDVTAITRNGTAVEGAASQSADLADLGTFEKVAANHDVVVIAVPSPRTGESHEPFIKAQQAIVASKVPARIFIVGGAGALEIDGVRLKDLPGFPEAYLAEATTFAAVLDAYRASEGLDWTMLAPAPEIAPGERTGVFTLGLDSPAGDKVSTQDFAVAALDEIEAPKYRQRRFTVAN